MFAASNPASEGLWLTLEVQNPASLGGHHILHVEDLVGPDRVEIPGLPRPAALLLFTTTAEDCADPRGLCRRVREQTEAVRKRGALVVAVVLTARERVPIVREKMAAVRTPIVLALDPHHHVERAFGLRGPGRFLVLDADGVSQRVSVGSMLNQGVVLERDLVRVVEATSYAMARVTEDEE